MKKGLAVIRTILLIVLIFLVGFGGYTAYLFYTDLNFDLYGLMPTVKNVLGIKDKEMPGLPEELQKYAVGEDADMFMILKMDDLPDFGEDEQFDLIKDLDTVILLGSGCPKCILGSPVSMAVLFDTEEAAASVKTMYDEDQTVGFLLARYKSSLDGRVLVISNDEEPFSEFSGRLADNPIVSKFTEEDFNANFVFYADNTKIPEFSMALFALVNSLGGSMAGESLFDASLPVAHAQSGLISPADQPGRLAEATGGTASFRSTFLTMSNFLLGISKEIYGFVDYKEGSVDLEVHVMMPTREEFSSMPVVKGASEEDLDRYYEQSIGGINVFISTTNGSVEKMKETYPELNLELSSNALQIDLAASFDTTSFAPSETDPGDAPSRARDAARIADANSIITVLEVYNADNGTYPEKTDCVGNMDELQMYFMNKKSPTDPKGARSFETEDGLMKIECEDGYLYQNFGDQEYVLWAELENSKNGRMAYLITDKADFIEQEGGHYFAYGNVDNSIPGKMSSYDGLNLTGVVNGSMSGADGASMAGDGGGSEASTPDPKTGVSRGVKRQSVEEIVETD